MSFEDLNSLLSFVFAVCLCLPFISGLLDSKASLHSVVFYYVITMLVTFYTRYTVCLVLCLIYTLLVMYSLMCLGYYYTIGYIKLRNGKQVRDIFDWSITAVLCFRGLKLDFAADSFLREKYCDWFAFRKAVKEGYNGTKTEYYNKLRKECKQ